MSHVEDSRAPGGPDGGTSGTSKPSVTDVLFDLRTVIGGLFLVYGLVCLIWGITSFTAADSQRTGGVNLNLWAGLGMLAVGAFFVTWSLRRPVLPTAAATADDAHGNGVDVDDVDGGPSTRP